MKDMEALEKLILRREVIAYSRAYTNSTSAKGEGKRNLQKVK